MEKVKSSLFRAGGPYIGGVIAALCCGIVMIIVANSLNTVLGKVIIRGSGLLFLITGITLLYKSIRAKNQKQ